MSTHPAIKQAQDKVAYHIDQLDKEVRMFRCEFVAHTGDARSRSFRSTPSRTSLSRKLKFRKPGRSLVVSFWSSSPFSSMFWRIQFPILSDSPFLRTYR